MLAAGRISHLNLPVRDFDASLDFYVRRLGLGYVRHLRPGKVILDWAGFAFFIEAAPDIAAHPRFHFGIETTTDGVRDWEARLARAGIAQVVGPQPTGLADTYVTPDGIRTVLYFADPTGHVIEVYSHIGVDTGHVDPHWAAVSGGADRA
jgi:catechol 2,3-dioxygenase-like lactoylglutathione lyase family enzyme